MKTLTQDLNLIKHLKIQASKKKSLKSLEVFENFNTNSGL